MVHVPELSCFDQVAEEVDDLDLGLKKKKKKAKDTEEDGEGISSVRATTGSFAAPTDLGPNDIYPYAQILQRIYDALSEKNPELMGGKKFTMIPPQVQHSNHQTFKPLICAFRLPERGRRKLFLSTSRMFASACIARWSTLCRTSMRSWL